MTFFELLGGVVLFGILWLFIPRTSFVVLLGLYLRYQHGFFNDLLQLDVDSFGLILLSAGAISSLVIDLITIVEMGK